GARGGARAAAYPSSSLPNRAKARTALAHEARGRRTASGEDCEGLLDRLKHALGRLGADLDRLGGAVEVEQADAAEHRIDDDVRWVAGEPRAGDPILHDVEGFHHDRGDAGTARRAYELTLDEIVCRRSARNRRGRPQARDPVGLV